jgi:hypothetical protein
MFETETTHLGLGRLARDGAALVASEEAAREQAPTTLLLEYSRIFEIPYSSSMFWNVRSAHLGLWRLSRDGAALVAREEAAREGAVVAQVRGHAPPPHGVQGQVRIVCPSTATTEESSMGIFNERVVIIPQ